MHSITCLSVHLICISVSRFLLLSNYQSFVGSLVCLSFPLSFHTLTLSVYLTITHADRRSDTCITRVVHTVACFSVRSSVHLHMCRPLAGLLCFSRHYRFGNTYTHNYLLHYFKGHFHCAIFIHTNFLENVCVCVCMCLGNPTLHCADSLSPPQRVFVVVLHCSIARRPTCTTYIAHFPHFLASRTHISLFLLSCLPLHLYACVCVCAFAWFCILVRPLHFSPYTFVCLFVYLFCILIS